MSNNPKAAISFLLIFVTINYLSWKEQNVTEAILTQQYFGQEEQINARVISFDGLMMIEQTVVCLLAWIVLKIWQQYFVQQEDENNSLSYNSNQGRINRGIEMYSSQNLGHSPNLTHSSQQSNQASHSITIPIQCSLILGIAYFLSKKTFSSIQIHLNIDVITGVKSSNLYFVLLFVRWLCLEKSSVPKFLRNLFSTKTIDMSNYYHQVVGFIIGGSSCFLLIRGDLEPLFFNNANLAMRLHFDWISFLLFALNILLEYVVYGALFWIKSHCKKAGSLELVIALLKYSAISFIVWGLMNGKLTDTVDYLVQYPQSVGLLSQMCLISLIKYLLLSYSLLYHPLLLFILTILSKEALIKVFVHFNNPEQSYLKIPYYLEFACLILFVIQLWRSSLSHKRQPTNIRVAVSLDERSDFIS